MLCRGLCRIMQQRLCFGVAYMQLFERIKTPAQLSPVFKRNTKRKGHIQFRTLKSFSQKKNLHVRKQKPKLRNHKGLLKRVKIVGPLFQRRFKFLTPGRHHLRRNKTSSNLKRKKLVRYIHKSDMERVRKLIPYFKRKNLKTRY